MARINFYQAGDVPCIRDADGMEAAAYRNFCAEVLRRNGCREVSVPGGLSGRDAGLYALREGKSWLIQCRRYEAAEVTASDVKAAEAERAREGQDRAAILSHRPFSEEARHTAAKLHVTLWGREELDGMIHAAFPDYNVDYYQAMQTRNNMGGRKFNPKTVMFYLVLAAAFFLFMKLR